MADTTDDEVEALARDLARLNISKPREDTTQRRQNLAGSLSAQLQEPNQKPDTESYGGHLPRLPGELKNQTMEMIPRRRDQAALLRACRRLRELVLPMLYHTVVLETSDMNRLDGFLSKNAGHAYLRSLTILPNGDDEALATCMLRLIDLLPCDILRTFYCDATSPQLRQLYCALVANQQGLENALVIGDGGWPWVVSPAYRKHFHQLGQRQAATVLIGYGSRPAVAWNYLISTQQELFTIGKSQCLTTLEVAFEADEDHLLSRPTLPRVMWQLLQMDAPLLKCECPCLGTPHLKSDCFSMRGTVGAGPSPSGRKLASVNLRGVKFHKQTLLPEFLSPEKCAGIARLTTLVLQDCESCGDLIDILASVNVELCLKRLIVVESNRAPQGHRQTISSVTLLLRKFVGLQTLAISVTEECAPRADAVAKHSATLRELYIGSPLSVGRMYSLSWYREICSACHQLEQFSLPLPLIRFGATDSTPIQTTPLDEPATNVHTHVGVFRLCLDQILRLPKLVTLRIVGVSWDDALVEQSMMRDIADTFATLLLRIFKAWGHTELSLIALGQEDDAGQSAQDRMQCYLVRNMGQSWRDDGHSGLTRMDKSAAMEEEPRSEILDIQRNSRSFLRFRRSP